MKYNVLVLLLSFLTPLLFASCDVDFDANDDWHETMLVYGVLDQDNDTNFVRIEKCFLGKGNYVTFSKQKDSLYYKQEDLQVSMYAYFVWDTNGWDTTKAEQKYYLQYTTRYKDTGAFYADNECPIYFTTKRIYQDLIYHLVIRNKKTGTIVSASTPIIADYSITDPTTERLAFSQSEGIDDYQITLGWNNKKNSTVQGTVATCFQPVLKFNCSNNVKASVVSIPFNYVIDTNSSSQRTLSYLVYRSTIVSKIKAYKDSYPSATLTYNYDNPFDLYIYACTKELKRYIDNNTPNESLTERALYTNVTNGIGIFAARRLHIKKSFTSCDNITQTAIENALK